MNFSKSISSNSSPFMINCKENYEKNIKIKPYYESVDFKEFYILNELI